MVMALAVVVQRVILAAHGCVMLCRWWRLALVAADSEAVRR